MKTLISILFLFNIGCAVGIVKKTYHPQKEAVIRIPNAGSSYQLKTTKTKADKMIAEFCAPQKPMLIEVIGQKHRYQCVDKP